MFERGHERGRNVATNVAETWPTKWLIGHVVTWPACSAMLWAMFRPRWTWPKRGYKRGQNMTALRRTWPETWPATWPRTVNERGPFTTNAASNVASNAGHVAGHVWSFFNFFHFFCFFSCSMHLISRKRSSHKCALLKSSYHSLIRFFHQTFQNAKRRNRTWKILFIAQTG